MPLLVNIDLVKLIKTGALRVFPAFDSKLHGAPTMLLHSPARDELLGVGVAMQCFRRLRE